MNVSDTDVENGGSITNETFDVDALPTVGLTDTPDAGCRRYLNKGDVSNLVTFVIMATFIVLKSLFPGDRRRGQCGYSRLSSAAMSIHTSV